jgi:hypothetical protein
VTFWRKFLLPLMDPDSATSVPANNDRPTPPPMHHWAVPLTTTECGIIADGLDAYDRAVRDVAYGPADGDPHARHHANRIAELAGAAHAHGYQMVPLAVDTLPALEHLLNDMLKHTRIRSMPSTTAYATAVRRARVFAGMAPVKGWALNRKYGTEWLNGEPMPPVPPAPASIRLKVTPPDRFPRP